MKIVIMGSGGIGGYVGAVLARAGEEVAFIARGAHLKAMRTNGLRIASSASGDFNLPKVRATDNPGELGEAELVLIATKAYDLEAAAESIRPIVGRETTVLPLLNGVDISGRVGAVLGKERVLGGLVMIGSSVEEPGAIRQTGPHNQIVFGEFSGEASPRVRAIEAVCKNAGFGAVLSRNIEHEIWKKFIFVTPLAGVSGVTRKNIGAIRSDPETRRLLTDSLGEIEAVARKKGVELPEEMATETLRTWDSLQEEGKPSLMLDLERGKPLELEALTGTVVRLGAELGVETPVNRFIFAALKLYLHGGQVPR